MKKGYLLILLPMMIVLLQMAGLWAEPEPEVNVISEWMEGI